MPKSSSAKCTPAARSAATCGDVLARIALCSVTSSHTSAGSTPAVLITSSSSRGQVRLLQLHGGHVDAHPQPRRRPHRAATGPAGGTPGSSTQCPIGTIAPVSSASGMNTSGGTGPRRGWCHRQQRLERRRSAGAQLDDRLVVHRELAAVERVEQVGAQVEPVERAARRGVVEHLDPAAAARPWPRTWRRPRRAASRWPGRPAAHAEHPADAGRDRAPARRAARNGSSSARGHPAGRRRATSVEVADAVEHHDELVAAEAGQQVAGAQAAAQPVGHLLEQVVAGLVAEPVVDRLEPVEVAEEQARRGPARRLGERLVEPLRGERPVGQAGQRVVGGAPAQLVLEPLAVVDHARGQHHRAVRRAPGAGALHPGPVAGAGAQAVLHLVADGRRRSARPRAARGRPGGPSR